MINDKNRPETLNSTTTCVFTGLGKLYITITEIAEGKPYELFPTIGKSGKDVTAMTEAIGRLINLIYKLNGTSEDIVDQLIDIEGEKPLNTHGKLIKSIPDAIAKVLRDKYPTK